MSAMEEQPVHLCAQGARESAPDSMLHEDARQFFFLEKKKWDRDKSSGGGEKNGEKKPHNVHYKWKKSI